MSETEPAPELSSQQNLRDRIAVHHTRFICFLVGRVEDAATAEDILQSAYVKLLECGVHIREKESSVACAIWLPQDPRAAEPRGLERRQISGVPVVEGRGLGVEEAAPAQEKSDAASRREVRGHSAEPGVERGAWTS